MSIGGPEAPPAGPIDDGGEAPDPAALPSPAPSTATPVPAVGGEEPPEPELKGEARLDRKFELYEALVLALAAVLTAWAAFQSTKWGGDQADQYSKASADRTESSRLSVEAGQLRAIDVTTFTSWISALGAERRAGEPTGIQPDGTYVPVPNSESGFLYARFRTEFKAAIVAWLAQSPLTNPNAAATPFSLPEYRLASADQAAALETEADAAADRARRANDIGDQYVLMTILFALVLLFVSISSKMDTMRARVLLFSTGCFILLVATAVTLTYPISF
jgi:hypothetical protein